MCVCGDLLKVGCVGKSALCRPIDIRLDIFNHEKLAATLAGDKSGN
jgi:hypothetical protein